MNVKRIATIALSFRDYENFDEKLEEACRWVSLAARMGAELAVLPEMMNFWRGDGPNNLNMLTTAEMALEEMSNLLRMVICGYSFQPAE